METLATGFALALNMLLTLALVASVLLLVAFVIRLFQEGAGCAALFFGLLLVGAGIAALSPNDNEGGGQTTDTAGSEQSQPAPELIIQCPNGTLYEGLHGDIHNDVLISVSVDDSLREDRAQKNARMTVDFLLNQLGCIIRGRSPGE